MKKKQIPKIVRHIVWDKYIGKNNACGKCQCCSSDIHINVFHCGHIVSEFNGGVTVVDNLIPLCALCNLSMGRTNFNEFKEKYGLGEYDNKYKNEHINEYENENVNECEIENKCQKRKRTHK